MQDADGTELANVSYAYDTFDNMTLIHRGDGMKYALAYNEFHNLEECVQVCLCALITERTFMN